MRLDVNVWTFFKLGDIIGTTELYILILVWLTSTQGLRSTHILAQVWMLRIDFGQALFLIVYQ